MRRKQPSTESLKERQWRRDPISYARQTSLFHFPPSWAGYSFSFLKCTAKKHFSAFHALIQKERISRKNVPPETTALWFLPQCADLQSWESRRCSACVSKLLWSIHTRSCTPSTA